MDQEKIKTPKLSNFNYNSTFSRSSVPQYETKNYSSQSKQLIHNNSNGDLIAGRMLFTNEIKLQPNNAGASQLLTTTPNNQFKSIPEYKISETINFMPYNSSIENSKSNNIDQIHLVKSMADTIINQKDTIIECQKVRIEELESQCSYYDHKLEQSNSRDINSDYIPKSRSYGYQNKHYSAAVLEDRLCAVEYEFDEHKQLCSSHIQEKEKEIEELKKLVNCKMENNLELTNELEKCRIKIGKMEKEIQQHLLYIGDLPTKEQHLDNTIKISRLEKEKEKQLENLLQLNKKHVQLCKTSEENRILIDSLKLDNSNLISLVDNLKDQCNQLTEKLDQKTEYQELENLKNENYRILTDCQNLKKNYSQRLSQANDELLKERQKLRECNKQLVVEQTTISGLNHNLASLQQSLEGCQKEIQNLSHENQLLVKRNGEMEVELKTMRKNCSEEDDEILQNILKELRICFKDIQMIVKSCGDKFEGLDVDITHLFGSSLEFSMQPVFHICRRDLLENCNSDLKRMRSDIKHLQNYVLDFHAKDVASTCTQQ